MYNGGLGTAVNEAGGVSSVVVGRAIATDTVYSLVRHTRCVCACV